MVNRPPLRDTPILLFALTLETNATPNTPSKLKPTWTCTHATLLLATWQPTGSLSTVRTLSPLAPHPPSNECPECIKRAVGLRIDHAGGSRERCTSQRPLTATRHRVDPNRRSPARPRAPHPPSTPPPPPPPPQALTYPKRCVFEASQRSASQTSRASRCPQAC
jgi:hypothetical protein